MSRKTPVVTPGITREGRRMLYDEVKVCVRCNLIKDVAEFWSYPSKKGSLGSYCKICVNEVRLRWEKNRRKLYAQKAYEEARLALIRGETIKLQSLPLVARRILMRQLIASGRSPKYIAHVVGCKLQTVYSYRRQEKEIRDAHRS